MNVTIKQVIDLSEIECDAATSAYGPLASMHEGWAVAREEMEETAEALIEAEHHMQEAWAAIRQDRSSAAKTEMAAVQSAAIQIAGEAIQVAAVCKRFQSIKY